jgi:hypothetical protein
MADEQEAIAPSGQETAPAPEAVKDEPQIIPEPGEELDEGDAPAAEADDDGEDVEWNGKTFRAPKGLKDGILMQADYTKKTQTVAEKAKALEARERAIEERQKATDAELDIRAHLRTVNAELKRFEPYDWNAYQQARIADPMAADEAWNYAQHLRNQKSELEGNLGKAQQTRTQEAQRDLAKRVEEAKTYARTNIKGWTPDLDTKIGGFVKELGVPQELLARNMGPKLYEVLHKAYLGHELLKTQSAAPKPATTPVPPLATVNGRSTPAARGNLADMDMEAYAAARKKGVGGKALR